MSASVKPRPLLPQPVALLVAIPAAIPVMVRDHLHTLAAASFLLWATSRTHILPRLHRASQPRRSPPTTTTTTCTRTTRRSRLTVLRLTNRTCTARVKMVVSLIMDFFSHKGRCRTPPQPTNASFKTHSIKTTDREKKKKIEKLGRL